MRKIIVSLALIITNLLIHDRALATQEINLFDPYVAMRQLNYLTAEHQYAEAVKFVEDHENSSPENNRLGEKFRRIYLPKSIPDPDIVSDLKQAKETFFQTGNTTPAKACTQKSPNFEYGYIQLGYFYFQKAEDKKALAAFKRALEIAPDNVEALEKLGNLYIYMKNKKMADLTFKKALDLEPCSQLAKDYFEDIALNDGNISQIIYFDRRELFRLMLREVKADKKNNPKPNR